MPDGDLITVPGAKRARQQAARKQDTEPKPPTRYALALRRQAANRVRQQQGKGALPGIGPGGCSACDGWGVSGPGRKRCSACGGTGG